MEIKQTKSIKELKTTNINSNIHNAKYINKN